MKNTTTTPEKLKVSFEKTLNIVESDFNRLKTLWDIFIKFKPILTTNNQTISTHDFIQLDGKIVELFSEFETVSLVEDCKHGKTTLKVLIWTENGYLKIQQNGDYMSIIREETAKVLNMKQELS